MATRLAAAGLAAALLLTACTGDGESDPQDNGTTQVETSDSDAGGTSAATDDSPTADDATDGATDETTGGATEDADEAESAEAAGIDPQSLGEPFMTVDVGADAVSDDATLTVDTFPLRREGELLTLVLRITLNAPANDNAPLGALLGQSVTHLDPVLVDSVNLNQHSVLRAGNDRLTSGQRAQMSGGQTRYFGAVFAAPPEDVTTMTLLFEGLPTIADIPIR
ncbi:MAG: hypothetical protein Q4G67_04745 [Actinomycetia bacterium]|nr:hypothetical protein [Actinomycetes bacterium]